jgi:hypothetical protein
MFWLPCRSQVLIYSWDVVRIERFRLLNGCVLFLFLDFHNVWVRSFNVEHGFVGIIRNNNRVPVRCSSEIHYIFRFGTQSLKLKKIESIHIASR